MFYCLLTCRGSHMLAGKEEVISTKTWAELVLSMICNLVGGWGEVVDPVDLWPLA